jgi:hypothetical protein
MSLYDYQIKKKSFLNSQIKSTLEQIKDTLQISEDEWLDILKVTQVEYSQFLSSQKSLPLSSVIRVADNFELSLTAMMDNKVDYRVLLGRFHENVTLIPKKYLHYAFSRYQTVSVMLDYIEKTLGSFARGMAIRYFQIPEVLLADDQGSINCLFFIDFFDYLNRTYKLTPEFFLAMGRHSTSHHKNRSLGLFFKNARKIREIYELMFGSLLPLYEQNCQYKILSMIQSKYLIQCHEKKDLAAALKIEHVGNIHFCLWKIGVFSSATGFIGLPNCQVKEKKCVHLGDSYCLFEIDVSHLNHLH